jgi:antitoxin MazE
MKAAIIKIGNSRGIRIPKPLFKQCGFQTEVELEVRDHELVVRPMTQAREGWAEAFQSMNSNGDDHLLMDFTEVDSGWDDAEWEWK